jgi:prepilin-type N-terminal cleavage/methylation domain-containing protein
MQNIDVGAKDCGSMNKRISRGFSLIELILATTIMVVVSGFGLYSLSQGRERTQSRGMAEEIAEELKAARQEAISKQTPIGIAFPSANRSTGRSQSFYQLEGVSKPRVVRAHDYSETYPESCFFWGAWGGAVPESTALSDSEVEFDLATWTPIPNPENYLLVFTPQGTVKSDGLPLFNGEEYRLLVCNGVQESPGAPFSSALGVSKPYTVRIGKTGAISAAPGVYGATIPEATNIDIGTPAKNLPVTTPPSGVPNILELRAEPKPKVLSDGGAVTVVPEEGFITLVAEAEDPSGGPLTMEWVAEPRGGASGTGNFSSVGATTMIWDPKYMLPGADLDSDIDDVLAPRWVGRVNWTPPPNAQDGDLYDLSCTVRNPRGGDDEQQLGTNASVEVVLPDRVACVNTDGEWMKFYIAWMNPEGSNVVSVTVPDSLWDQNTPVWSPNGTKLAFFQTQQVNPPDGEEAEVRLYVVNDDGTGLKKIYDCTGDVTEYDFGPSFSPDGAQVTFSAYETDDYRNSRVFRGNIYGTLTETQLTAEGSTPGFYWDHSTVTWNPSVPRWILYNATKYSDADDSELGSAICVYDISSGSSPPYQRTAADTLIEETDPTRPGLGEPHWSFNGTKIVYYRGTKLCYVPFNTANGTVGAEVDITPIVPGGFDAIQARFSPRDDRVAVVNLNDSSLHVVDDFSPLTHHLVTDDFGGIQGYNWSAEADEFVFSVYDNTNLYTIPVGGGTPQDITPPGFLIHSTPSWWAK